MLKKATIAALCCASTLAWGEAQRALLTHENKYPELHQLELGYEFRQREFEDFQFRTHSAQARFGVWENLTAILDVPWAQRDNDFGDDESGIGDVEFGLDLVAYQDIFGYPYVIPHVAASFSTGDEDEGLGTGETMYLFGVSIGTVVYEVLHYVLDVSFAQNYDAKASEEDDALLVSLSLLWDLSDRFNVAAEGRVVDLQDTDDESYLIGGGFTYEWTENFQTGFFYGGWQESDDEDRVLSVRANYTF